MKSLIVGTIAAWSTLAAPALPQNAPSRIHIQGEEGWTIFEKPGRQTCFVVIPYDNGGTVTIAYNRKENFSSLIVAKPQWSKLAMGRTLYVRLIIGRVGEFTLSANVIGSSKNPGILIEAEGMQLKSHLAKSDGIIIVFDNTIEAEIEFPESISLPTVLSIVEDCTYG